MLDGVYRCGADGVPEFVEVGSHTDDEGHALLQTLVARLMKLLTRRGVLVEDRGQTYLAEPDADAEEAGARGRARLKPPGPRRPSEEPRTRLRCQRQPGWRCAACRLDVDGPRVNPGIEAERGPRETSGAGRIGPKQQPRRQCRQFKALRTGIGWQAKRPFEIPMRSMAHATQGQTDKEIEWQRQAVALAPQPVELRLRLVELYQRVGDKERAGEALEDVVRSRQGSSDRVEAAPLRAPEPAPRPDGQAARGDGQGLLTVPAWFTGAAPVLFVVLPALLGASLLRARFVAAFRPALFRVERSVVVNAPA